MATSTEEGYPFWHRPTSGYWHYYVESKQSVCGNWHLLDKPIPADATKRMPSRAHGGGGVCKTCERKRP